MKTYKVIETYSVPCDKDLVKILVDMGSSFMLGVPITGADSEFVSIYCDMPISAFASKISQMDVKNNFVHNLILHDSKKNFISTETPVFTLVCLYLYWCNHKARDMSQKFYSKIKCVQDISDLISVFVPKEGVEKYFHLLDSTMSVKIMPKLTSFTDSEKKIFSVLEQHNLEGILKPITSFELIGYRNDNIFMYKRSYVFKFYNWAISQVSEVDFLSKFHKLLHQYNLDPHIHYSLLQTQTKSAAIQYLNSVRDEYELGIKSYALVMERKGLSLTECLKNDPYWLLPRIDKLLNFVTKTCKEYNSKACVIHADLHTGNILYDKQKDEYTIIDFTRSTNNKHDLSSICEMVERDLREIGIIFLFKEKKKPMNMYWMIDPLILLSDIYLIHKRYIVNTNMNNILTVLDKYIRTLLRAATSAKL